jgi:sec-independent protein translocase protein TatC
MARLNLGWLKPPKASPDGVMSLADHLRELRYRIIVSALVIVVGLIVCWIFYLPLYSFLLRPYEQARPPSTRATPI